MDDARGASWFVDWEVDALPELFSRKSPGRKRSAFRRLHPSSDVERRGFQNPPEARFCAQCATSLTEDQVGQPSNAVVGPASSGIRVTLDSREPQAIDGQRKTVTPLFADIKGSTELMRDLDPEEASAVIDPVLRLMIEAVHRYEGFVPQSSGDGIFALFGAPIAHEDHPQRALHAEIFGRQCGAWRSAEWLIQITGLCGYPDAALERSREVLSAAQRSSNSPVAIAIALDANARLNWSLRYSGATF